MSAKFLASYLTEVRERERRPGYEEITKCHMIALRQKIIISPHKPYHGLWQICHVWQARRYSNTLFDKRAPRKINKEVLTSYGWLALVHKDLVGPSLMGWRSTKAQIDNVYRSVSRKIIQLDNVANPSLSRLDASLTTWAAQLTRDDPLKWRMEANGQLDWSAPTVKIKPRGLCFMPLNLSIEMLIIEDDRTSQRVNKRKRMYSSSFCLPFLIQKYAWIGFS